MALTYFKRFRMELCLSAGDFSAVSLPDGYQFYPWDGADTDQHAAVKYHSFIGEIDSDVFPCLGDLDGCSRLMGEIAGKEGFLPEATWLLGWQVSPGLPVEYCGTIQGIRDRNGNGAIQNLGITPSHRGQGLGRALLYKALAGFQIAGMRRAVLEVTTKNAAAVGLYKQTGFRRVRTLYKAVDLQRDAVGV